MGNDAPAVPGFTQYDDGDTIAVSSTTSAEDLQADSATPNKETPPKPATPKHPATPPDKKTPAPETETEGDEAATARGDEPPAHEKKTTASTPEGRVAQLKQEIKTLTYDKHKTRAEQDAATRELATARAELADLNRQIAEKKTPPAAEKHEPAARAAEPKEEDFEDFREWVTAHSKWTREQAKLDAEALVATSQQSRAAETAAERQRDEEAKLTAERTALAKAHEARIKAFEAENPDFGTLMAEAGSIPTNDWMDEHILHSEHGPALMQYLAENPEECERIAALGLGPTLIALGKIEARFDSAPPASETKPRPSTKAKPPVSAIGGTGRVAGDADEDDSPLDLEFGPEYVKRMNARDKRLKSQRV